MGFFRSILPQCPGGLRFLRFFCVLEGWFLGQDVSFPLTLRLRLLLLFPHALGCEGPFVVVEYRHWTGRSEVRAARSGRGDVHVALPMSHHRSMWVIVMRRMYMRIGETCRRRSRSVVQHIRPRIHTRMPLQSAIRHPSHPHIRVFSRMIVPPPLSLSLASVPPIVQLSRQYLTPARYGVFALYNDRRIASDRPAEYRRCHRRDVAPCVEIRQARGGDRLEYEDVSDFLEWEEREGCEKVEVLGAAGV